MYVILFFLFIIFCWCLSSIIGMNIFFLALGAIIACAIIFRNKSIYENLNKVPEETLHVVNLEKSGVFELSHVGPNFEKMTLTVLAKHLYQEGDFSWFELECDKGTDEKTWVEVEDDDETLVTVVLQKMKLTDINTSKEKLKEIDYNESGLIKYDGKNFKYIDSGDAIFYRFCDDTKAENLYYWDFQNDNQLLSVERWGERNYEVFLSQKMRPSQIRVLRNKD